MTRHHVYRRRGPAALVAVVLAIGCLCDSAAANETSKGKGSPPGGGSGGDLPTCHAWAVATSRANEKVGENRCRQVTIKALAHACAAIPESLRRAAGEVQDVKDPAARARILATTASAALGEGCTAPEPLADARKVANTCPLPSLPSSPTFRLDEELMFMRAADYLILNAMIRSLVGANQFDESIERLI